MARRLTKTTDTLQHPEQVGTPATATVIDIQPPPPERLRDAGTALAEIEECDALPVFIPILEGLLTVGRDMLDVIDKHYSDLLGPFEDALKKAKAQKQGVRKSWDAVITAATAKLATARRLEREEQTRLAEEDRKRRQALLDAEAERQRQETVAQLVDKAVEADTTEELANVVEALEDVTSKPVQAAVAAPLSLVPQKMTTLAERTDYVIERVDEERLRAAVANGAAPAQALMVNLTFLNKEAAKAKQTGEIFPGVYVTTREVFMRRPGQR